MAASAAGEGGEGLRLTFLLRRKSYDGSVGAWHEGGTGPSKERAAEAGQWSSEEAKYKSSSPSSTSKHRSPGDGSCAPAGALLAWESGWGRGRGRGTGWSPDVRSRLTGACDDEGEALWGDVEGEMDDCGRCLRACSLLLALRPWAMKALRRRPMMPASPSLAASESMSSTGRPASEKEERLCLGNSGEDGGVGEREPLSSARCWRL